MSGLLSIKKESNIKYMLYMLAIGMNVFAYSQSLVYKAIILLFNVYIMIRTHGKLKIEKYHVIQGGFILLCMINILLSPYEVGINVIFTLMYCLVTVVVLHSILRTEERIEWLLQGFIISAYILFFVMLFHFGVHAMLSARVGNEVVNTNRAGTIFSTAAFFSMFLRYRKHNRKYIVIAMLLYGFALLSGSKTALIIGVIAVGLLITLKDGEGTSKLMRNIVISIALLILVYVMIMNIEPLYYIIGARFKEFLENITGRRAVLVGEHSMYMRLTMYQFGIKGFFENPILGHGIDSFRHLGPWPGRYSHSNVVELAFNLGIVGLLSFYTPYLTAIKSFRISKCNMDKYLKAFMIAFFVYYFFYGITAVFYNELYDWCIMEVICTWVLLYKRELSGSIAKIKNDNSFANKTAFIGGKVANQ